MSAKSPLKNTLLDWGDCPNEKCNSRIALVITHNGDWEIVEIRYACPNCKLIETIENPQSFAQRFLNWNFEE